MRPAPSFDAAEAGGLAGAALQSLAVWKDLTLSIIAVVVLALGFGFVFSWLYPNVDLTAELGGLFLLMALLLRFVGARLRALFVRAPVLRDPPRDQPRDHPRGPGA